MNGSVAIGTIISNLLVNIKFDKVPNTDLKNSLRVIAEEETLLLRVMISLYSAGEMSDLC
jgi:hypothetical protein